MTYGTPRGRIPFLDHFYGAALRGEVAGVAENSGTAAIKVGIEGGVCEITTGGADGNRAHLSMGLNWKPAAGSMYFETRMKSVTAATLRAFFIGFTDTVAQENPIELGAAQAITSNASDAAGFIFDTAATIDKWYVGGVKANIDTALTAVSLDGTHQAPVADEWQSFGVEVNSDGDAVFYYGRDSGSKYGLREVARIADCVTPDTLLTPHVGIETRDGNARTAYVDYFYVAGSAG